MPSPSWQQMTRAQLRNYINTYIVPNGLGLIIGEEHNNVENNLLDFIYNSYINSGLADIITSGGNVTLSRGVTIITGVVPNTVIFGDNDYNEWVISNRTTTNINFANGLGYYDINNSFVTYIPAKQVLKISKGKNGNWFQTNNFSATGGSGSGNVIFNEIDAQVGIDSPIILNTGDTTYTINSANIANNSVKVYIDGQRIFPNVVDQISVDIIYTPNFVTITFFNYSIDNPTENLGLQYGMKVIIDYAIINTTPIVQNITTEDGFNLTTEDGQNITT